MKEIIQYSDIDLRWIPHPLTEDVNPRLNIKSIEQSIENLFFIDKFDIPFDPDAYCNLKKYLFEPITFITAANLGIRIEWMIKKYESRVKVIKVDVIPNDTENGFDITLVYKIRAFNQEISKTYSFQRVR